MQKLFNSSSSISNKVNGVKQKNIQDNTSNKDNQSINCSKSIDIFLHKNEIFNENLNENWQRFVITSFVPKSKMLSMDPKEIIFKGLLNKLILSNLKQNCPINVEKFCLLTKDSFCIYKSKESCLLMQKPQHDINVKNILVCKRMDLSVLKILKLQGLFFFYIKIKQNESPSPRKEESNIDNNNDEEEVIREILLLNKVENKIFILFSYNEIIIDQWVCLINHFLNK